mmetsp:Transcript_15495/g.27493  ORF Transcript_15495/g.27493 Transcript_15495/m.27493 type:complete len:247 (-) Transcript_15495:158-898(-)
MILHRAAALSKRRPRRRCSGSRFTTCTISRPTVTAFTVTPRAQVLALKAGPALTAMRRAMSHHPPVRSTQLLLRPRRCWRPSGRAHRARRVAACRDGSSSSDARRRLCRRISPCSPRLPPTLGRYRVLRAMAAATTPAATTPSCVRVRYATARQWSWATACCARRVRWLMDAVPSYLVSWLTHHAAGKGSAGSSWRKQKKRRVVEASHSYTFPPQTSSAFTSVAASASPRKSRLWVLHQTCSTRGL